MWSAIGAIGAGLVSGLFGKKAAAQQTAYNRQAAEEDRAFQREVFQNQIQWKAQDAKKAGLHPLAALGGGAYSASSVSTPGVAPDYSGPAMQMAKGIGDAFAAYKSKDELAAEQAIAELRATEMHNSQKALLDAQSEYYKSMAQEATKRSLSYTRPMATGREPVPGQVDSRDTSLRPSTPGSDVVIRPISLTDDESRFGRQAYDINMHPDRMQEIGDEVGQVQAMLEKAARENKKYFRDELTGIEYEFDRRTGKWYMLSGGGGGV